MTLKNYISADGKLIRNITNSIEKLSFFKKGKIIAEKQFDQPKEIPGIYIDYVIDYVLQIGNKEVFMAPENSENIRLGNAVKEAYHKLIQES